MDQESDTDPHITQKTLLLIMSIIAALAVLSAIVEYEEMADKIDCQNTNIHLDK